MTSLWSLLTQGWAWDPTIALGCAALWVIYLVTTRFHRTRQTLYYTAGVAVLLLALVSPLDTLGDSYLLTAHMAQHLLLLLVVPPLLLLGIPDALIVALDTPALHSMESRLAHPAVAWTIGVATLYVWHLPYLYEAALESERLHIIEHLSFLVSAAIFWWPIICRERSHLSPPAGMIYLMAAGHASMLLALLIAFFPHVLYSTYLHPKDMLGIMVDIRGGWGLSAQGDQQLAGLLMAFPGSLIYIGAIFAVLYRWFSTFDTANETG